MKYYYLITIEADNVFAADDYIDTMYQIVSDDAPLPPLFTDYRRVGAGEGKMVRDVLMKWGAFSDSELDCLFTDLTQRNTLGKLEGTRLSLIRQVLDEQERRSPVSDDPC